MSGQIYHRQSRPPNFPSVGKLFRHRSANYCVTRVPPYKQKRGSDGSSFVYYCYTVPYVVTTSTLPLFSTPHFDCSFFLPRHIFSNRFFSIFFFVLLLPFNKHNALPEAAPSLWKIRHYQALSLFLSNLLKLYSDQLLRSEKKRAATGTQLVGSNQIR